MELSSAQAALVEAHRAWAVGRILDRYRWTWRYEPDELRAIAVYALVVAASRFDATAGIQFTTYAQHVVLGEIRDERRRLMRLHGWATRRIVTRNGRVGVGMVQVAMRAGFPNEETGAGFSADASAVSANPGPAHDDVLDQRTRCRRVLQALLHAAPDRLARAVVCDWFRAVPMAEIADRRGLTLAMVKNTVFRCKERVRQQTGAFV